VHAPLSTQVEAKQKNGRDDYVLIYRSKQIATIPSPRRRLSFREGRVAKFEVLGGDFDKGDGWIYHDGSFVFRKDNRIQKTIPHDQAREFDEASEGSLARLGLSRLLPDLWAAQLDHQATLAGSDIVLYFDDHKAALIRADETARQMIGYRVKRGYAPAPPQEGDNPPDSPEDY
jgi:hypothetical protein